MQNCLGMAWFLVVSYQTFLPRYVKYHTTIMLKNRCVGSSGLELARAGNRHELGAGGAEIAPSGGHF
jgi:hypothetical protein